MSEEDLFGPLVSTWLIQQRTLTTLRAWYPTYLAEVERQEGLEPKTLGRPEQPLGYYPGVDFFSAGPGAETPANPPLVIVSVAPHGSPEMADMWYEQLYQVQIATIVRGDTEEESIQFASLHGAAQMLLAHIGDLGGLAERTVMSGAPEVEFADPNEADRRLMRAVTTFDVHVAPILNQFGPSGETPEETPEITELEGKPKPLPTATETTLEIKSEEP